MKRICLVLSVLMLFNISGCGIAQSRVEMLNAENKNAMETIYKVEDVVIQALENKDANLLKSIFSEKALSKAPDIDKGIDYIFDLYEGEFVEITERNHSAYAEYSPKGNWYEISAWCYIRTTEDIYVLEYIVYSVQEQDPSAKGVFSLELWKYIEGEYSDCYSMAGIETPDREKVHVTLDEIYASLESCNASKFIELCSFTLDKSNFKENSEEINNILNYFSKQFTYSIIRDGWIINDDNTMHVYVELAAGEDYIMYYRYDTSLGNEEKIYLIKFTEIKEGTSLKDYELGENLTEPGVYFE